MLQVLKASPCDSSYTDFCGMPWLHWKPRKTENDGCGVRELRDETVGIIF